MGRHHTRRPGPGLEEYVDIFEREREESLAEEGRILVAEVASLVLVLAFVLARMIWFV